MLAILQVFREFENLKKVFKKMYNKKQNKNAINKIN
jgi:hypothetical protein